MYHNDGAPSFRCGSLAKSGCPVVVCDPATTQLLDPTPSTPEGGAMSARCCHDSMPAVLPRFRPRNSAA